MNWKRLRQSLLMGGGLFAFQVTGCLPTELLEQILGGIGG